LVFDSGRSIGKRPFSVQRAAKWESLKLPGGKIEILKSAGHHTRTPAQSDTEIYTTVLTKHTLLVIFYIHNIIIAFHDA